MIPKMSLIANISRLSTSNLMPQCMRDFVIFMERERGKGADCGDSRLTNLHLPDGGRHSVWHMPHAAHAPPTHNTHTFTKVLSYI